MATKTTENYTKEMTTAIVAAYTACGTNVTEADHDKRAEVVKTLALEHGKAIQSVRSKLVNEKVYIPRAKVSGVTGEKPEKKEVLAARLVAAAPFKLSADSVAKMNKTDIQAMLTHFNSEIMDELEDETEQVEVEQDSPES